jgi:mannose-6-phosphate isomerase-like protein (cupin superfamily)
MKMKLSFIIMLITISAFSLKNVEAKKSCCKKTMHKKTQKTFNENIFELAKNNTFFRKEIITGPHSQLVLMSIPTGQDIGKEVHKVDQTFVFVQGHGHAIINNMVCDVLPNHLVFVPAGTPHNFKNIGLEELKLFTIYAPAQHKPGTIEKEKSKY